jgi:predicted phage tail protein
MKIKVTYIPVLFDDSTWKKFESHNETIISIFISMLQKFPEVREDSPNLTVRVNGKILHPLKWRNLLNDGDEVLIVQEVGIAEIVAIWGALTTTVWGIAIGGTVYGLTIPAMLVVASIAYTIYSYATAPKPPSTGQGLNSSPTYGWDGLQMQVRQGVPVPIVSGEHLLGGNLIEAYISSDADKNYLNLLIALGEGPIEGIMKEDLSGVCTNPATDKPYILINDNLLSNFLGMTWDYRLGTHNQTQIDGFGDICQTYSMAGVKLSVIPYVYTTVDSDVEAFELRFRIPLLFQTNKGNYYPNSTSAHIEYKLHSEPTTWTEGGVFSITEYRQDPLRRFFRIDDLAPNQYDIRITFTGWDVPPGINGAIYLDNIIEVKYDTLTYPLTALLAIKILATEQLSGGLPNVLTRIRGRKVLNLDTSVIEWTRNPIYNVNDLMVNSRYGTGRYITQANINNDQLILMADHCDQMLGDGVKRGVNSVTGTSMTDSDYTFVTGDIGRYICCNCPTDATVFTTLLITSLSDSNHCANGTAGWTAGTPPTAYWEFGEKRNELDLVIDAQNPAFDLINQICGSFRALPIWNKDAIQLLIDKKESPSYIFNMGNILEGSFKHSFQSEKSKPNCVQVDYADRDGKFQKKTVDVTDFPTITGGVPKRTRRLSLLGASRQSQVYREGRFHLYSPKYQDEQISFKGAIDAIHMLPGDIVKFQHDVFAWGQGGRIVSATTTVITLDQPVVIGAGTYVITCKLADDTLETRGISDGAGTYTTVHCAAFTTPPPIYSLYALGLTSIEAKPFRIMKISKTPENEIEVVATEYSESVYTDTDIILAQPVYSGLPPDSTWPDGPDVSNPLLAPPDVTGFAVVETTDKTGVSLTFVRPATTTNWTKANIYISRDAGATYEIIGIMYDIGPMIYRDVMVNSSYNFKAISLSPFDVVSASPPVINITITGIAGIALTNLTATSTFKYIILDWVNPVTSNIQFIEIWRSDSNNRAAASLIATVYADNYWDLIGTVGTTKYYWIRAKNINGAYSAWLPSSATGGVTATTAQIVSSDIGTFAILASQIYTKIPIITGDAWTNNSPSSGYVAWNEHTLYYNGVAYTIVASNTNLKYIYWLNGGTSYTKSNTNPTLTDADFVIAVNINGAHDLAWNALANQVVGSLYVENASILNSKMGILSVDTANIVNLSVNTIKIANQAVSVPVAAYTAGSTILTAETWTAVQQLFITTDGSPVFITASGLFMVGNYWIDLCITQEVYGVSTILVWEADSIYSLSAYGTLLSFNISDQPLTGSYHYYFWARSRYVNSSAMNRSLMAQCIKK